MESEIFGHKRGAFTGAACDRAGLIREAEGGTLFLDEIDCLTPQAQVKLLRFLQDGEYRSVGSEQIRHANIRVIAAANADFNQILRSGKFREDLFYRLKRTRHSRFHRCANVPAISCCSRATFWRSRLRSRILGPKIFRSPLSTACSFIRGRGMCVNSRTCSCAPLYFPTAVRLNSRTSTCRTTDMLSEDQSFQTMKSRVVWQFEHDFLTSVLHAHHGNISRAAVAAKKNRRAFWQLLRKHGLLATRQTRLSLAHVT